jgi:hypothetical protein
VVLDKRTVTEYDSTAWQTEDEQALFGPIAGGHVSLPVFGKHLVFDGMYTDASHFVRSTMCMSAVTDGAFRVAADDSQSLVASLTAASRFEGTPVLWLELTKNT